MEAVKNTPFTPGNEGQLPTIIVEEPKGANWQVRVVPNKFAIVRAEGQPQFETHGLYTFANNYGFHEIVVEGQRDSVTFAELGAPLIEKAIATAIARVQELSLRPQIKYVAYFKNERPEAGASINHPHSQIIATSVVPEKVKILYKSFERLRKEYGFSPLYKVLDSERGGPRMVFETKHFAVLCPYASKFAFETWIIPLRDASSYTTMTTEERVDLANIFQKLLGKLGTITAPYNVQWNHSKEANGMHWFIQIAPRLNIWAGFEFQTGIIVNPVPPENAASFYRT